MDFKTDENAAWKKLRPEQAKDFLKDAGESTEELSVADLTDLLGRDDGGRDEEEDYDDE